MNITELEKASAATQASLPLEAVRTACTSRLSALCSLSIAVVFASISTVDGRAFAHVTHENTIVGSRISALTSSLLALCHSLSKEGLLGQCEYGSISSNGGSIVLVRVPTAHRMFTLSIGADSTENIATVLRNTLDLAHSLREILDRTRLMHSAE